MPRMPSESRIPPGAWKWENGRDLLVLNVPHYREIPRRLAVNSVSLAMRDGKIVFSRSASKVRTN